MSIETEKKDPNAVTAAGKQGQAGQLTRDKQGNWHLIKPKEEEEHNAAIERATSLDHRVVANLIAEASIQLAKVGIQTGRLDAENLLMSAMVVSKENLIKNWTKRISEEDYQRFQMLLGRRLKREPVAYITGKKEFYGQTFVVDKRVLVPRPESEALVELAVDFIKKSSSTGQQMTIADVGTGCGAIALSIAHQVNFVRIFGIDQSAGALEVAKINANLLGLNAAVGFMQGDLLLPLPEPVQIVIANLPYIPPNQFEQLEPEVTQFEPRSALIGTDDDGLGLYRRMLEQLPQYLLQGGKLLMEYDPSQTSELRSLVLATLPSARIEVLRDYQGLDRIMVVLA